MAELVDIGAARLDAATNTVLVQAKAAQIGTTPDDAPSFDDTPIFGQLGVHAVPYGKDDRGNAQAILDDSVPGHNGVVTSVRDTRASKIVQQIAPGETGIGSTGPEFDAVALFKKQLAAILVGDDCAVVMDRENKRFTISCFGLHFEMSEANGIVFTDGKGATTQLKDGTTSHLGQQVLGGRTPVAAVAYSPTPVVGVTGSTVPALGVFIGV